MKLACLQENLVKSLNIVARAAQSRASLPVLGNILLATDKGRLKLQATNLELTLTAWMGAKIEEEGAVTVPSRTLVDWVKQLPPERIDLELDAKTSTLRLQCARLHANIKGIAADEFPTTEILKEKTSLRMEPDVLKACIAETAFAAATDEARPVLQAIAVEFGKDKITFAAADGFRLSVRHAECMSGNPKPQRVLVPLACMQEVARVLADEEDHVAIALNDAATRIEFKGASVVVSSSLVDGKFPDYSRVLPQGFKTRTVLNRAELKEVVQAAEVFAREVANRPLCLKVEAVEDQRSPSGDGKPARLLVTATSPESGSALCELEAWIEGEAVAFRLHARYLKQALDAIVTPQVALELNGPDYAVALKPTVVDNAVHVIMPQQVGK